MRKIKNLTMWNSKNLTTPTRKKEIAEIFSKNNSCVNSVACVAELGTFIFVLRKYIKTHKNAIRRTTQAEMFRTN